MSTAAARLRCLAVAVPLLWHCAGCSALRPTVPARRIHPAIDEGPRSNQQIINFAHLRQEPPSEYLLGPHDVLGIYIEGVLGSADAAPPVQLPDRPHVPPAIGYPIPIREDGTLSLPMVPPIKVSGLSVVQAEQKICRAFTQDQKILRRDQQRIIVTLMRPRTYKVIVVREDAAGPSDRSTQNTYSPGEIVPEPEKRGTTRVVELRAYENDVLHALSESGGLPGVDAKCEVKILRAAHRRAGQDHPPQAGSDHPSHVSLLLADDPHVIRIPLRFGPDEPLICIEPEDVILEEGDIVFIESRESEVFYTGGLLRGGQFPLPRDYDLDVLGAIALAGGSVAAAAGGSGTVNGIGRGAVGSICPPTRVIVLRTVDGQQQPIRVNLKRAVVDPRERILIQPNDFILLEYTPSELAMNVLLNNVAINLSLNELFE